MLPFFTVQNEEQKPEAVEESSSSQIGNSNHVSEPKKEAGVHSKVQPTTEQLMIAKIIDHWDDPHQRKKIQQVMDVTGKPEDEVATALFDAGWDESRAVELLLEDGDHLSAWEETGKKKKGKKTAVEDDDGWGDRDGNEAGGGSGGFQDPREKNSRHLDCGNLFLLLEEEVMNSFNYKKKCVSLSIIDSIRNEMSG